MTLDQGIFLYAADAGRLRLPGDELLSQREDATLGLVQYMLSTSEQDEEMWVRLHVETMGGHDCAAIMAAADALAEALLTDVAFEANAAIAAARLSAVRPGPCCAAWLRGMLGVRGSPYRHLVERDEGWFVRPLPRLRGEYRRVLFVGEGEQHRLVEALASGGMASVHRGIYRQAMGCADQLGRFLMLHGLLSLVRNAEGKQDVLDRWIREVHGGLGIDEPLVDWKVVRDDLKGSPEVPETIYSWLRNALAHPSHRRPTDLGKLRPEVRRYLPGLQALVKKAVQDESDAASPRL